MVVKVNLHKEAIELILARNNKSQNWLAGELGVSSGYISQLMTGERNPSPKLRAKFLELLPKYSWDLLFEIEVDER